MLTDLTHAYDYNHLVNPSYTGPLIQVAKNVGGNSVDTFLDIDAVDGKVDRDAIVTFSGGSPVYLYKIYDQMGTSHFTYDTNDASVQVVIYDGTSFPEDTSGRIFVPTTGGGGRTFETPSLSVTGDFSIYTRVGPISANTEHVLAGFGGSSYFLFQAIQGDSSTNFVSGGYGSPTHWIENTSQIGQTRGQIYDSLSAAGIKNIGVTGGTYPASPPASEFQPFRGRFNLFEANFGTTLIYNADTEASHTDILAFMDDLYVDVSTPSVTFNDSNDNPIVGANVTWIAEDPFAATSGAWTSPAIVGSNYVTDANGVATYDPNTDPAVDPNKVYTAVARYLEWDGSQWVPTMGAITAQNNVDLTAPV